VTTASVAFPVFVNNVIAALKAAPALKGVLIVDGPQLDTMFEGEAIIIGHDGVPAGEVPASSAQNKYGPLGALRMDEMGSLDCVIRSYPNKTIDLKTLRDRAGVLLGAVIDVIRIDPSFSHCVQRSGLGHSAWFYTPLVQNFGVKLTFSIDYEARV
jgi:hypothetical protein